MRILHLTPRYLPARGGAEIHIAELSRRLAAAGHVVTVVTSDALDYEYLWDRRAARIGVSRAEELLDGVLVRRYPVRHLPGPTKVYDAVRRLLWLQARLLDFPTPLSTYLAKIGPALPDLWQALATSPEGYDLVAGINIGYETFMLAGQQLARRQGIPFVAFPLTHLGAGPTPGNDARSRFYTLPHQRRLVVTSDALVAQTATEGRYYQGHGLPIASTVVAGPGIDPDAVSGGRGERWRAKHGISGPILLGLGTLSLDKGTATLIDAFLALAAGKCETTLILAGHISPEIKPHLPNDHPQIKLLGPIAEQEKLDLLDAADILLMPSRIDSFGIAFLEAWANKKPVIGASAWGIDDVISEGENGMLVPFGDVAALKSAIEYLLDHPGQRVMMGQNGHQTVIERHTWPHKFEIVHQLYQTLTAR